MKLISKKLYLQLGANIDIESVISYSWPCLFLQIDRLFEWKRGPASQIEDTIKKQKKNTKLEFEERVQLVVREFAEQVTF